MLKLIFLYRELSDQLQIYALLSGRYVSKIGVTIFFFGDYKNNTGSYYAVDRGHPGPLYTSQADHLNAADSFTLS